MSALTVQQATTILETLSLLQAKQHEKSKLVIHSTSIELESDSSTLRTTSSWATSASSTVWYYAGFPTDSTSRDLADLPPLMRRVSQAFLNQDFSAADEKGNKTRLDLAQKALDGLTCLVQHEYISDSIKAGLVETAQESVRESITHFKQLTVHSLFVGQGDQQQRQIEERDQQIVELTRENASLLKRVQDKQENNNLLSQMFEEKRTENNKLKALVVKDALDQTIDLQTVPSSVLIGRIHVMTGILATRRL
ncbi:MAG TPA: hypothetical protein VIJ14_08325 [Rhabdochlamydiaceae bacterium]